MKKSQFQFGMLKLIFAAVMFFTLGNTAALPNQMSSEAIEGRLSPVIFIQGNGGSQLEARVDSEVSARSYGCPDRNGWFRLWLNVWDFLMGEFIC